MELPTGGTAISPDVILVTPLPVSSNPGFSFNFDENATEGELLQSRFAFTVLVNPGGKPIARVRAALANSAVAPDGTVTAVTDLCLGTEPVAGLCDSESETLILFDIGVEASLQESRGFAPLRQVGVLNDIVLDGGTGGSASLSSLTIRFQEVPEPATFVPVIAGLLALTLLRRRR